MPGNWGQWAASPIPKTPMRDIPTTGDRRIARRFGGSESHDIQPRDQLEMADIPRPDRIPEFQRANANRQIRERDAHTGGSAEAIYLTGA